MSAAGQAREWSSGRLYAALVVGAAPSAPQRAALVAAAQGRITGIADVDAAGATLTGSASIVAGEASGQRSPTAAGQFLAVVGTVVAGAASGQRSPELAGQTLTFGMGLAAGTASGRRSPTLAGQVVAATAVLIAGTASASQTSAGSQREQVLKALFAALGNVRPAGAAVLRNAVLPERIPGAGIIILRDGDPGEPAVTLSPLRYHYQHRAEVEAVVQVGTGRDAAFDSLTTGVGIVLAADRTLGGCATGSSPRRHALSTLPSTARPH